MGTTYLFIKRIVRSNFFERSTIFMIVVASILVGLETREAIRTEHLMLLWFLNRLVMLGFTMELCLRLLAEGPRFWNFFKDPWNIFDVVIVVACFLPLGEYIMIVRLFRVARILRLVKALPRLRILVVAVISSLKALIYIGIFIVIIFYFYGTLGVSLWGEHDPEHFRHIPIAFLTLFRVLTLEDWTDVMYHNMEVYHPSLSAIFFCSFVIITVMVLLNLVVGVMVDGVNEAHKKVDGIISARDKTTSDMIDEMENMLQILKQTIVD